MSKYFIIILVLWVASLAPAFPVNNNELEIASRGIIDLIIDTFGLADVWYLIQDAGATQVANLVSVLTQVIFRGQTAISQAKTIISELIKELKERTVSVRQAVFQAISDLTGLLGKPTRDLSVMNKRDIYDWVIGMFGLTYWWDRIEQVNSDMASHLFNQLYQIAVRGQGAIVLARPILAKMLQEIIDNPYDGGRQAVFQAILDLEELLTKATRDLSVMNERGIFDWVISLFGLNTVWEQIQEVGADKASQLLAQLLQIALKGKGAIDLAKPIIANLISELIDHTVSARQAVFQAISDLTGLLGKPSSSLRIMKNEHRDIFTWIVSLFGLGEQWEVIQSLGSVVVANLMAVLTEIVFKGKAALDASRPIIKTLLEELKDHSVGAKDAVLQAISDLKNVVLGKYDP